MQPVEYSQFLKRWVEKFDPEQAWLRDSGETPPTASEIQVSWQQLVTVSTQEFDREARLLRNQTQAGLIHRLLNRVDSFEDTVRVTTQMAEAALEASLSHHRSFLNKPSVFRQIQHSPFWVWVNYDGS